MTARQLSPTASLLKGSKLFSLPPPLPRPVSELGFTLNSSSDSATLPYPVQASIETTESGLARGDWGLKRPLPLKSTTKSSTPCVEIDNIDSIDHITDFRSAAPYTRTLKKWQDTRLPISKYSSSKTSSRSVFESKTDNTCSKSEPSPQHRWKFEGPWLAGLTEEEYLNYLHDRVRNRRSQFRRYLQTAIPKERQAKLRKSLRDLGENDAASANLEKTQPDALNDADLDIAIRDLRQNPERLDRYIAIFLDLPRSSDDSLADGPPSTHPSAGLSYQRSNAHTINHPLYGPQEYKSPVEARVLLPQRDARGFVRASAVLGVGGIVTTDSLKGSSSSDRVQAQISNFSPDIDGGPKVWVQLDKASVTPMGRVQLQTSRPEPIALVAKGVTDLPEKRQATQAHSPQFRPAISMPGLQRGGARPSSFATANADGYGLMVNSIRRSERAKPIDGPHKSLTDLLATRT